MEQSDIAPKTKENINLLYKHTHKDFKSIRNGVKYVMWFDNGTDEVKKTSPAKQRGHCHIRKEVYICVRHLVSSDLLHLINFGPIESMPEDIWHNYLRSAKKKEEKETV